VSSAKADTVTFASFQEHNTGNEFQYSSTGVAGSGGLSTFNLSPPSIAVDFLFLPNTVFTSGLNPVLTGQTLAAHMTMGVTSPTGVVIFGGFAFQQNMNGAISFSLDTPVDGKTNLLTINFNGVLSGINGGHTATLGADSALGDVITFTSDFISFTSAQEENMSLTFTSILDVFTRDKDSHFYQNFTAHGTGSFAGSVVPEPSTLAGAFAGVALAGLAVVRRRRAAQA
jgi:hypothetical protein